MSSNPLLTPYKIPVKDAEKWTAAWQCAQPDLPKAFRFERAEIDALMREDNVCFVRFYISQKPSGHQTLIAVGVTADDQDIVEVGGKSMVYDFSKPCPPTCDTTSKLYHVEPCEFGIK